MEFGVHLPLIDLGGGTPTLAWLRSYVRAAAALDYRYLCANDHLLFARPWLDGPTALAAVLDAADPMTIATTVALPVVRGPTQTAKLLSALDVLSGGRLIAGVGPGSSARDYAAAGIAFEERWRRFDESVLALRALLRPDAEDFNGAFYSTAGVTVEPHGPNGPPLWIASWGSPAGLRRVARLGDGWLASAYNITPAALQTGCAALGADMPNALATTWLHVTESRRDADRMRTEVLAPLLGRRPETLRDLPIGPAEECAQRLSAYAAAGAQRVFLWPLVDELQQLQRFQETVVPLLSPN
ncbi:LLM class flavin-dependent oxidoreductase [Solirubrobacter taibaiensis]|nr:LLM class flavin-dependent oxidoreductase [Solirubrobacter taibaiensis]